jgi:hypothetical protein
MHNLLVQQIIPSHWCSLESTVQPTTNCQPEALSLLAEWRHAPHRCKIMYFGKKKLRKCRQVHDFITTEEWLAFCSVF